MTRGLALVLAITAASFGAAVLTHAASAASAVAAPRLTTISSKTHSKGTTLTIEATEPVPYLTTQIDPLTVVFDFRNVSADGFANDVKADPESAVMGVSVETTDSVGTTISRVKVSLTQPVAHKVRSDRRAIVVDFDKPSEQPYVLPPVSREAEAGQTAGEQTPEPVAQLMEVDPIAALGLDQPTTAVALAAQQTQPPTAQSPSGQAPPPVLPQPGVPPPEGTRRFTGNPISMDFQGADLRAVLRTFAEISGLNVVMNPAVQGTVDVALRDVPWDQALDIILRANRLGYLVDDTVVRIAPLTVLADEEAQRRRLATEQALAGDLRVTTRTLSYARAENLQQLLTRSALSQRGTVQIDARTNTVIITDLPERHVTANELIDALDRPEPQVEIEARIVQTTKDFARALGVQWGFNGRLDPALGNTTNLAFPNSAAVGGIVNGRAVNLPAIGGATSGVALALGSVNGAFDLDVALTALERSGNGRLLSSPRVTTQNNIAAEMTQGVQIPIQVVSNNTVTVSFKDAALTLKVTPQITAAGTVIMQIAVENASPDFSRTAQNGVPAINTQRANTTVLVTDGETTVIGGISTSQQTLSQDRTPGLGRIPILNWLFKRDTLNDASSELLIFITPRIVKG